MLGTKLKNVVEKFIGREFSPLGKLVFLFFAVFFLYFLFNGFVHVAFSEIVLLDPPPNCGDGICGSDEDFWNCENDCESYEIFLDVGSSEDSDISNLIYLKEGSGISTRGQEEGYNYRNVSYGDSFEFFVNSSKFGLEEGPPYRDLVIEVGFKDVLDEEGCEGVGSDYFIYCKPRMLTMLHFDKADDFELQSFGGLGNNEWRSDRFFIESTPWQTIKSFDGLINFSIFYTDNWGGQRQ